MKANKNKVNKKKIAVFSGSIILFVILIFFGLKFRIIHPKNLLGNVSNSGETNVTLMASRDVGIYADAANAGYYQRGSSPVITYRGKRMGLYWFDLSSIPKDAKITDARLVLYSVPSTKDSSNFDVAGSLPIYLVQTLPPNSSVVWSEGGGVDTYDQYKGTSWLAKDTDPVKPRYVWSDKPGRFATGDIVSAFESSPLGNMNFVKAYGAQTSDDLSAGITRIIQNNYQYEGFVVDKGDTGDSARKDNIATKEYPDASMHPALKITYNFNVPVVDQSVVKANVTTLTPTASSTGGLTPTSTNSTSTLPKEMSLVSQVSDYVLEQVDGVAALTNTKKIYSPTTSPLPGKCQTFTDANTGMKVTRISDVKDIPGIRASYSYEGVPGRGMHDGYSKYTDVNVTGQYAIAYGVEPSVNGLYDLKNCTFIKQIVTGAGRGLGEAFDVRWDLSGVPGTETTIYYYYGSILYKQDVLVPGSEQILFEFRKMYANEFASLGRDITGLEISTEGHMDQSTDARYRGVKLYDYKKDGWAKLLLLDTKEKKVIFSLPYKWGFDISPSGKWFYTDGGGYGPYYFYDIPSLVAGKEVKVQLPIKNNHGHDGWAYDKDGNEVYVYQDNATDWISAFNPATGKTINIINLKEMGWGLGQHMARISNPDKKGWLLMGTYSCNTDSWAYNQIFMIEIKPSAEKPRIWRIASTNNSWCGAGTDKIQRYFAEAFVNIDHAGNNVYVGSNWGAKDNLELYRIALPTDWEQSLK